MSSYFSDHGSTSGSPYFAGSHPTAPKPPVHHHGVVGLVENLAGDVKDAAVGLPAGIVQTVEHPAKTAKAVVHQYAETYGPLVHGDVSKFLHGLYAHPLGPILDLATVVTGGAGLAARGGALAARAGLVAEDSRLAQLGHAGEITLRSPRAAVEGEGLTVTKPTSRDPARRAAQRTIHSALNRLPQTTTAFGEFARFAREVDHLPRREAMAARLKMKDYNRAIGKLSPEETAAVHLIGRATTPDELLRHYAAEAATNGAKVDDATLKVLTNAKVRELVANPPPRVVHAAEEARKLAALDAELKQRYGVLDEATAKERPYLHARIVSGAKFLPDEEAMTAFIKAHPYTFKARVYEEFLHGYDPAVAHDGLTPGAFVHAHDRGNIGRLVAVEGDHAKVHFINEAQTTRATVTLPIDQLEPIGHAAAADAYGVPIKLQGGKSIDEIRGDLAAQGRPEPFYVPDVSSVERVRNADFSKMGGGFGVQHPLGSTRQNRGVLMRIGRLALEPDLLGPEYLRAVKYGLFEDIHDTLLASAVRIPRGTPLPKGWVFIRRRIGNSPERIPHLEKTAGQTGLERLIPNPDDVSSSPLAEEGFTTISASQAEEHLTYRLIVPKAVADHVAGEFTRSNAAVRLFLEKPTAVWRALVLGYRIGFLTNNVVGNHLLYAIRFAGIDGLRAYAHAVAQTKGLRAVRGMLGVKGAPAGITQQFMAEFFPEQVEGTFGATQGVVAKIRNPKARRAAQTAKLGVVPATQAVAEGTVRRAAVEAALRKSPEVRAAVRSMPTETRRFEDAAKQALDTNPHLRRTVSDEVNAALGNYLNLSPFERNAVRSLIPFYAWYRAITHVVARMAVDTPGRTDLLVRLSEVGLDATNEQLGPIPDYLKGLLPVGAVADGRANVLATAGANPFNTIAQLTDATGGLIGGKPGDTGRAFSQLGPNPFVLAAMQNLAGHNLFTGRTQQAGVPGLPASAVREVGAQIPVAQLAAAALGHGRQSKLYGQQTGLQALLQYLGVPVKPLNVNEAHAAANR